MCEACDLRKTYEDENLEASAILLMLLGKIHASVDQYGAMDINMKLNPAESDRLCAWGAANEDIEEDDPPEDDMPPEESENLESDSRVRFGPGETTDARKLFAVGRRVVVVLDNDHGTEIVGTVRDYRLGADWPRYVIEIDDPKGATLEVDSCEVLPAIAGA